MRGFFFVLGDSKFVCIVFSLIKQAGRIAALDKLAKEYVEGASAKNMLKKIEEAVKSEKARWV